MLLFDTLLLFDTALYVYIPEHIPFKFSQTFDNTLPS